MPALSLGRMLHWSFRRGSAVSLDFRSVPYPDIGASIFILIGVVQGATLKYPSEVEVSTLDGSPQIWVGRLYLLYSA